MSMIKSKKVPQLGRTTFRDGWRVTGKLRQLLRCDCRTNILNMFDMWRLPRKCFLLTILNVFDRHTLLNKLCARRKCYPLKKMLTYLNRVGQLAATPKSISVEIDDQW